MPIRLPAILLLALAAPAFASDILIVQGTRLAVLHTGTTAVSAEESEYEVDSWPPAPTIAPDAAGGLSVSLRLDSPNTPYYMDVRLYQDATGHVDVELEVACDRGFVASYAYDAKTYAMAASVRLYNGVTLGEALASLADGYPPLDYDRLVDKLATVESDVTPDTARLIGELDAPAWIARDRAAAALADRLPELRRAWRTMDLSAEAQKTIEALLAAPKAGDELLKAAREKP